MNSSQKEYLVEKFQYLDIHNKQQYLQIEEIYQWREPSCHNMNELNNNIRTQAEKEIYNVVQLNYTHFFQAIVDIIQSNRHDGRRASVTTLGYICQELKSAKTLIEANSCKKILENLLRGINKEPEISELSLQAIRDSIPFLRHILENKQYCDLMFEHIASVLNNPDQRQIGYQIMCEFCKHCYHIAINYLDLIIYFTIDHMRMRNQDSARALFLWETISTEYLERIQDVQERVNENHGQQAPNLIKLTQNQILPEIMGLMIITTPEDLDFVELREGTR